MNVIQVSTPLSFRGGEQQVAYLLRGLKVLGIYSPLFTPQTSKLWHLANEQRWPRAKSPNTLGAGILAACQLKKVCQREKADLIHCHDARAHTLAILSSWIWGNKTPIVVSRRVSFPVKDSWLSLKKYRSGQIRSFLCVSESTRTILNEVVPYDRTIVVKDGIDVERFAKKRTNQLRNKIGISVDTPLIGCVAALTKEKDLETFIETIHLLSHSLPSVHAVVIGDGAEREKLEATVAARGLTSRVQFLGRRSDVPELLPDLDLFLLTSRQEGLCQSLLEAMVARVPVVATRVGGIPEVVIEGESGLLGEAGDAKSLAKHAQKILTNRLYRDQLVANAFEWACEHSFARTAEQTLAAYEKAIS